MTSIPANVDLSALGIYNVKFFGAAGDGATDDTVAFQKAINAAYVAGGGIVWAPKSRYIINGGSIVKPPSGTPGDTVGASCSGLPAPAGFVWAQFAGHYFGPNCPSNLGAGGTLPPTGANQTLPNGPLILFDNVVLMGDGPEQTILLAGEQIYNDWMFSPTGGGPANIQVGIVVATPNWWADYLCDTGDFPSGYFATDVYVKNLSIDCQGRLGFNAGKPSNFRNPTTGANVPNANLKPAKDGSPAGTLYGTAVDLHATLNCGVDNVWVYDGNVNGILIEGTEELDAAANGPLPESFQQNTLTGTLPNNLAIFIPNVTPQLTNVPWMNAEVTNCRVDMNYPVWLAGTNYPSGGPYTGGSAGQLPIRAVGVAGVRIANNRVGRRNQSSNFGQFVVPPMLANYPDVPPDTNDAMDCPGAWHITITENQLTNCGDGIGLPGCGVVVVTDNLVYNFGSVGVNMPTPGKSKSTAKSASQTIISGNAFFLSSDSGAFQQAINYQDYIGKPSGQSFGAGASGERATSQQGDLIVADNIIYGPGNNIMVALQGWGITFRGNILDYGGNTPYTQPVQGAPGTTGWPVPDAVGVSIQGNDIIVEGNLFRNAGPPGVVNGGTAGIAFPAGQFPPPLASGDAVRVLIKGNTFDETIGKPISNNAGAAALHGVRVLDNIGANPPSPLDPSQVTPFPPSGSAFSNPYPYDCFVSINAGSGAYVANVYLNGVSTGVSINTADQKSFLVKAGGTILVQYSPESFPSWTWVGL